MWRGAIAAILMMMLATSCRADRAPAGGDDPVTTRPQAALAATPMSSVISALPQSPDGAQELVALDLQIEQARSAEDREALITTLSRRAMLRGRHGDLYDALERSQAWIDADRKNPRAWAVRIAILIQTHDFSEADLRFADVKTLAKDPSEWEPAAATLFEARGKPEMAQGYRERAATQHPSATNLTNLAANLAMRGKLAEAISMIPRAAAALRDPSPVLVAWLLVQWGRLYVQNSELAAARQLFEEAHRRMPGYVEATIQLATATRATGGDPGQLVTAALVAEPKHPELLALAGRTDEAQEAWNDYLTYPLLRAFADHAARFYLDAKRHPDRAAHLASMNFVNRDTLDARALLVEAELANADWKDACKAAGPLATAARAHQFLAWRAFTACGQTAAAGRLAQTLGIR